MREWVLHALLVLAGRVYPTDGAVVDRASMLALAGAIDGASHSHPIPGDDGVVEMAAELAVLSVTEGHYRAGAVGRDSFGSSYGAWQVHGTILEWVRAQVPVGTVSNLLLGSTAEQYRAGASVAAILIAKSHGVCAGHPASEALAWYASGGPTCSVPEGLAASRYRMGLAKWVRERLPVYWVDYSQ